MFDGVESADLKRLIEYMWSHDKIVSAVCHGPCALLTPLDASTGESILKGKRVTGFTNEEEVAVGKLEIVPYSLENRMKELGADYVCAPNWSSFVVVDGKLITGQNPQSSRAVAEAVADAILPGIAPQHGKEEGFHHRGHPVTREDHHDHSAASKVSPHPQVN